MAGQHPQSDGSARARAWAVHLFSASGAVLALLALLAVQQHRWAEAMLWLLAALAVDGVDGTLARAARVKEVVPRIDGSVLDLVIDYLSYVFVPTIFLIEARILPDGLELPLAALVQLSSLYVFARQDMKTEDGYFRGFPALWNIVALYLYAASVTGTAAALVVVALVALSFAPIHVVHPFRVRDYGALLPVLAAVWAISTLGLLLPELHPTLQWGLFAVSSGTAVAMIVLGLGRTVRGSASAAG